MKRKFAMISMIAIIGLLFSSFAVLAAPSADKPTPNSHAEKTPGANPGAKVEKKGKVQNFKGTISGKEASSLTLTLKDGSVVTLVINNDTRIKIPTMKIATVDGINLESQVVVQARADDTGALVAQKIQVIPGKPTKIHRVGVVTQYAAGSSITIKDKDGSTTTFTLTADIKILPKQSAGSLAAGDKVTIISRRDPTGGDPAAQGIVIHGGTDGKE